MEKSLEYAILAYVKKRSGANEELDVALDCLSNAFGVKLDDSAKFDAGKSLDEIFAAGVEKLGLKVVQSQDGAAAGETMDDSLKNDPMFQKYMAKVEEKGFFKNIEKGSEEYVQRYNKLVAKYKEKFAAATTEAAASSSSADNNVEEGDRLKNLGNDAILAKKYDEAVKYYTQAIEAAPTGPNTHLYYCNRAAAYLNLQKSDLAVEDCTVATTLSPDYAKAYARAGQAHLRLGNTEEAVEAAKRALELEPGNTTAKQVMQQAGASSGVAGGGAGGDPMGGLAGMMNNPAMRNMMNDPNMAQQMAQMRQQMGSGGGMPDIGSMMNNPGLMSMAQQLMSQPGMAEQMQQLQQQMMENPNMMEDMMKMMGGMGGLGGKR